MPTVIQGGATTSEGGAASTRQAVDATRRQQSTRQGITGTVRNVGGARGRGLGVTETARALKALTGQ
jgi:hypothetical protein